MQINKILMKNRLTIGIKTSIVESMKIQIWSDIACPFCFIGTGQLNKALSAFPYKNQVEVIHRSFQLNPDSPRTATHSVSEELAKKYNVPLEQAQAMNAQVAERAAEEGLTMNMDTVLPVNTFDGHRLIHLAAEHGKQAEAVERLFAAYFTNGENVADLDTLVKIGQEIGLDETLIRETLVSDAYTAAVREDINEARILGIQGVPFFVIDNKYGISGAQGTQVFSDTLQKVWLENNPLTIVGDSTGAVCDDAGCVIPQAHE